VLERTADELAALRAEVVRDPLAFWTPAGGSSAPGGGRPDTERYDAARRLLWSGPCDLRAARAVVLRYQEAAREVLLVRDDGSAAAEGEA
jgi:hypothetical protein